MGTFGVETLAQLDKLQRIRFASRRAASRPSPSRQPVLILKLLGMAMLGDHVKAILHGTTAGITGWATAVGPTVVRVKHV